MLQTLWKVGTVLLAGVLVFQLGHVLTVRQERNAGISSQDILFV